MHKLVIDNNEYEFPDDLTLDQWKQMMAKGTTEDEVISIVLACPIRDVEKVPKKTKEVVLGFIAQMVFPDIEPMNIGYMGYKLIDFDSMSFGKFIDLDVYLDMGIENSIEDIVKAIYNCDNVSSWPITSCWNGVKRFIMWRNALFFNYRNLFESSSDGEDTPSDSKARMWYDVSMVIAENKLMNLEYIHSQSVIECFNWLAWNKDYQRKLKQENDVQISNRQNH